MKITKVTKIVSYLVETDSSVWPDYRTTENGKYWENLMGASMESVENEKQESELRTMFEDYLKNGGVIIDDSTKDIKTPI